MTHNFQKAWVVSADMGYGHQRAAYPLKFLAAENRVITVGSDDPSSPGEKKLWNRIRLMYEFLSRVRDIPLAGRFLFKMLDTLLHIPPLYPLRDMSSPSFQVELLKSLVNKGLCSGMLAQINKKKLPLITSFYAPAITADMNHFGRVYCIICDSDLNRVWVAGKPLKSRIEYFVPCGRARKRLALYGVPEERIHMTGFPFPLELLGDKNLDILKADLGQRLRYLDPEGNFWTLNGHNAEYYLGKENCKNKKKRNLTITFAVGGAGAQKEIGAQIAESLKDRIRTGRVSLNLVAGTRPEVRDYFESVKRELFQTAKNVNIIFGETKYEYFDKFNALMRTTDILWTKPSELSFYCALGIPIIMTPPIGSQEEHNRKWLFEIQAGISQEDPRYTDQWLFDLIDHGRIADAAWGGFLKARKYGTYKIMEIIEKGTMTWDHSPLKR